MKIVKSIIGISLFLIINSATAIPTLTVWEDVDKAEGIEEAVAEFEKLNDCEVIVNEVRHFRQLDILPNVTNQKRYPDIICIPHDRLADGIENNLIAPVHNISIRSERYLQPALDAFSFKGEMYGYPKVIETLVLFYNKRLLPKPLETLDDYYEFSKAEVSKNRGTFGLLAKWDELYYAYAVMHPYGSYMFSQNGLGENNVFDIGFDNKGTFESVKFISRFYKENLFPLEITAEGGDARIAKIFLEDKVAAFISGPWNGHAVEMSNIDYGVDVLPMIDEDKAMTPFLGIVGYAITSKSKNKELAEKFLTFLNQRKYALERYKKTREIPPLTDVLQDESLKSDELVSAVARESVNAILMPIEPEIKYIWREFNKALGLAISDSDTVENIFTTSTKKIKNLIMRSRSEMNAEIKKGLEDSEN